MKVDQIHEPLLMADFTLIPKGAMQLCFPCQESSLCKSMCIMFMFNGLFIQSDCESNMANSWLLLIPSIPFTSTDGKDQRKNPCSPDVFAKMPISSGPHERILYSLSSASSFPIMRARVWCALSNCPLHCTWYGVVAAFSTLKPAQSCV